MPEWPTFRSEMQQCPACGTDIDAHTNTTSEGGPEENDFTICLICGTICCYNSDLSLRKSTQEDLLKFDRESPENFSLLLQIREQVLRLDSPKIRYYRGKVKK